MLDNCEHVLAAAGEAVRTLVAGRTQCRVLATSREPLGIDGELLWSLGPLELPAPTEESTSLAELTSAPAIALFLARMGSADPSLIASEDDLMVVADICQAVDGVPLAIELAAARIRSYTLSEIADQVHDDPARLRRLQPGVNHHHSVHAAIEWSHRLLSEPEQVAHRRLAALPGPFTVAAASGVCAAEPLLAADVPDLLAMLVNRSLLNPLGPQRSGGPSMFSQLATVRAHAARALAAAGEDEQTLARRDAWVAGQLDQRPPLHHVAATWCQDIDDAYPTVRATLHRMLSDRTSPGTLAPLAKLTIYWYLRNRTQEGDHWLALAAARPAADQADAIDIQIALVAHALLRGRTDLAAAPLARLRELAPSCPPDRVADVANAMAAASLAASSRGETEYVAALCTAVLTICAHNDDPGLALLSDAVTSLRHLSADPAASLQRAEALYARSIALPQLIAAWTAANVGVAAARDLRGGAAGLAWISRMIDITDSARRHGQWLLSRTARRIPAAGRPRDRSNPPLRRRPAAHPPRWTELAHPPDHPRSAGHRTSDGRPVGLRPGLG